MKLSALNGLSLALLLSGCAAGGDPAPAAAPKVRTENFTFRVTGISGQPGQISDD